MLSIQEMLCLVSISEKAMEPHRQVFHNVKEFVTRLKLHFNLYQVDINAVYHRYIPLLTGRTYQMYLSTKTQEVQAAENLRALVQIKPHEDENTESFSTWLWSLLDSVDPENLTISEMLLTLLLDSVPPSWKSKLLANINASLTAVSKLDYKSIVRLIADLHLGPEEGKSYPHKKQFKGNLKFTNGATSSKWSMRGKSIATDNNGVKCGNGCGQNYVPGHNKTCLHYGNETH
ncbi:hypothetical protein DFQ30_004572 [Apophysomyces sp. BC1015]|nr:hypothetical protein DFQ30_004572 [Apophysomyces sp. BC1015]